MTSKFIPVEEAAKEWFKDPKFVAEYDALEEEFALAAALIRARSAVDLTQVDVAEAMGTTQTAVARSNKSPPAPGQPSSVKISRQYAATIGLSWQRRAVTSWRQAAPCRTGNRGETEHRLAASSGSSVKDAVREHVERLSQIARL